jgi:hypothetical protein
LLRKLLICPWFGPLPEWWDAYDRQRDDLAARGYDLLVVGDLRDFRRRVRTLLDVDCPIESAGSKIHDFRPAFGVLFAAELVGYDFWGHTDFDCVYGRVDHFMPDDRLAELDVYSDHTHYLCGPWALYRRNRATADLFMANEDWQERLEDPATSGWVETGFTETANQAGLRILYEQNHGYRQPHELEMLDGRLREDGSEISFFHFRHAKRWPSIRLGSPA